MVELSAGADRERVITALRAQFDRMGAACPDVILFAEVPLSGRSRKPDRQAAARLIASAPEKAIVAADRLSSARLVTSRRISW